MLRTHKVLQKNGIYITNISVIIIIIIIIITICF